jgi:predicted acyl esterase
VTASARDMRRLQEISPRLHRILTVGTESSPAHSPASLRVETVFVTMRDGVRLATDVYLPPTEQAPTVIVRTPYGRAADKFVALAIALARRGYAAVLQDCRGTGDSEPNTWDYYMYEPEDGFDLVEWVRQRDWFDGFVGATGSSYAAQTQWCMAMHATMSAIVPEVSGLGIAVNSAHLYMFLNAYARSVGKGANKISVPFTELEGVMLEETLAGGYFNEAMDPPLPASILDSYPELRQFVPAEARKEIWARYCALTCARRAEFVRRAFDAESVTIVEVEALPSIFGYDVPHDAHTLPHVDKTQLCSSVRAPALMVTGWYDWGLNDALATWDMLTRHAQAEVSSRSRLLITPSAHNVPGYHEGMADHSELQHNHRTVNNIDLLLHWNAAIRERATDTWPRITYYLMGANEWRAADVWPPAEARSVEIFLHSQGRLSLQAPPEDSAVDRYIYDPREATPTAGGSIVSYVYPPGSVDVSEIQRRRDVLTYTTPLLQRDLDVVGPLTFILHASSSALDTDFVVRLSDVFPDRRAIQLQNGLLRARYRDSSGPPQPLQPGRAYRFVIDMWATANRFKAGHRLRIDISSADFPRFDRNSNRGGVQGPPMPAEQCIYHDAEHPSYLIASVLGPIEFKPGPSSRHD